MLWWTLAMTIAAILGYGVVVLTIVYYLYGVYSRARTRSRSSSTQKG